MALIIFSAVESEWMALWYLCFFCGYYRRDDWMGSDDFCKCTDWNAFSGSQRFLKLILFANEFMLVLIGITMALVLNLFYDYGSQRKALVENMRYTEERLQMILGEISAYLANKEMQRNVWDDICALEKEVQALSRMPMNIRIIRFTHIRDTISIILKCVNEAVQTLIHNLQFMKIEEKFRHNAKD